MALARQILAFALNRELVRRKASIESIRAPNGFPILPLGMINTIRPILHFEGYCGMLKYLAPALAKL